MKTRSAPAGWRSEGHGPAVVLLHSSMSSKGQWRALTQRLATTHRTIAIDLHGYGDMPLPADPDLGLDDEVERVEAVLAAALPAGERFHLVGHSFGGVVALRLAERRAALLRSLSLFEPVAFSLLPAHDAGWAEVVAVRREVERCLTLGALRSGTAAFIDYWSGAGSFAQMPAARQAALTPLLPKAALDFRSTAGTPLDTAALEQLTMPVLLMHGNTGPLSARRVTGRLHALMPRARLVSVAAGHMAPLTHAALVNPLLADFIVAADSASQQLRPQPQRRPEAVAG